MAMAMGIVGCAWDARTTMGTSGWSVLPYHQEATQLSSRRCRCLMLCTVTDLCVQGGTVEGDHYYHHVGGRLAHPSN